MYDWIVTHPKQFNVIAFWAMVALVLLAAHSLRVMRELKRYRLSLQGESAWALSLEDSMLKERLGPLYADYDPKPRPAHETARYRFLESYYDKIGRPRVFSGPRDYANGPSG